MLNPHVTERAAEFWTDRQKREYDDAAEAEEAAYMVLELIAADADAGKVMIPSLLRTAIDAALIKAGRKAAPEPVRHFTIAGVRDE
ncbi:TPA: hypothetical protein QDB46_003227 [Burkholderia multivorans]|nr:hypothetical protein [Burkholderia multivorans]HDR9291915.1 hypothetical protein [Burkholderia multivorans]HDR9297809.1 hypothetical protein [Burkholderia multivorans]HDR9303281.1 hypothetical protein [Burkholderia multivorans]HDR9309397.1 hypothetical protein [Burkholderia multivorans]